MLRVFSSKVLLIDCTLQAPKEPTPHLLPFMLPGVSGEQAALYRKVSKAMYDIHHNKDDPACLISIAQEWYVDKIARCVF